MPGRQAHTHGDPSTLGIELNHDMQLNGLLRAQGEAGQFANIDAEVNRRVAVLRSGDAAGVSRPGPEGETLILRGLPLTEGGFILLLNGLGTWEPTPKLAVTSREIDAPAAPEPMTAAPIEW